MVDYTGHFIACVTLSFCRFFSSYECKNEKWPTGCGVNFRLYQNMSIFLINYESVSASPCFRLNPQPNPSTLYSYNPNVGIFCDKIKLSDSCPWKYEYTQVEIYSTTKETHQSLLNAIIENRIKKWKYIYTIFIYNQFCTNTLRNVTVLPKSVHAVRQFIDKGSFSKMTSFSMENEYLDLVKCSSLELNTSKNGHDSPLQQ